jgi:hypothetical protein
MDGTVLRLGALLLLLLLRRRRRRLLRLLSLLACTRIAVGTMATTKGGRRWGGDIPRRDGIENKQMRAQRSTVLTSLAQLATARDRLAQRSVSERLLTFHRRARPLHHLTASEAVLPSWIVVRLRCGAMYAGGTSHYTR